MFRKRWFVPVAITAGFGLALLLVATASRYAAQLHVPPPVTAKPLIFSQTASGFRVDEEPRPPKWGLGDNLIGTPERIPAPTQVRVTVEAAVDPPTLIENADAVVHVNVTTDARSGVETVELQSESFRIAPRDPVSLDLGTGSSAASFVISPQGPGEKRLRLYAEYHDTQRRVRMSGRYSIPSGMETIELHAPRHEEILEAKVIPKPSPTFIGVGTDTWASLQALGTAIGAPSMLTLVITNVLDARKRRREAQQAKEDATPKLILPK